MTVPGSEPRDVDVVFTKTGHDSSPPYPRSMRTQHDDIDRLAFTLARLLDVPRGSTTSDHRSPNSRMPAILEAHLPPALVSIEDAAKALGRNQRRSNAGRASASSRL
jgi:hypothetical protein